MRPGVCGYLRFYVLPRTTRTVLNVAAGRFTEQIMQEYENLLEDEIFRAGEAKGRLTTAMTVLTDMLIELNSLEIYYAKPIDKSKLPPQINELRKKVEIAKDLVRESLVK